MTSEQRRQLLGESVAEYARAEGERAARDHPPGATVIATLRPILAAPNPKRRPAKHASAASAAPLAA